MDEQVFIKKYMDLAGVTEGEARSVCMYMGTREPNEADAIENRCVNRVRATKPIAAALPAPAQPRQSKASDLLNLPKRLQPLLAAADS